MLPSCSWGDCNMVATATEIAAFAQQRLWFLAQLELNSPAYNEPIVLRSAEPIDADALARALSEIVCRHEALRTVFFSSAGQIFQRVQPAAAVALPIVDLTCLPAAQREPEAMRLAVAEARTPFDLATGPLLRATLMRLGE